MSPLTTSSIRLAAMANQSTNWVFSPASYLESMYRVALCADNNNAKELATALGTSPGGLPVAATRFSDALKGFETYNWMLSKDSYRSFLVPAVLEVLAELGGGEVLLYSTPSEAVETVNRLVAEKTRGKIADLISIEHVKELTQLIILNCVYFKRAWYTPFDRPAYDEPFHNADGTVTQVGLLKRQSWYHYYEGVGYDIVQIPYQDTDICCYLIVPTTASLFSILERFDEHYANVANVRCDLQCHLTVPPFKIENTWDDLIGAAKMGGVTTAFDKTQQWRVFDWAAMGGGWAKVDCIRQKAFIDFTREGTEAAAATYVGMCAISGCCFMGSPPRIKYIRADKPFLFCLANKTAPETPLFVGAVNHL